MAERDEAWACGRWLLSSAPSRGAMAFRVAADCWVCGNLWEEMAPRTVFPVRLRQVPPVIADRVRQSAAVSDPMRLLS